MTSTGVSKATTFVLLTMIMLLVVSSIIIAWYDLNKIHKQNQLSIEDRATIREEQETSRRERQANKQALNQLEKRFNELKHE